jgi:hypothetical protein
MAKPAPLLSAAAVAALGAGVCLIIFSQTKPVPKTPSEPAQFSLSADPSPSTTATLPSQGGVPGKGENYRHPSQGRPAGVVVSRGNGGSPTAPAGAQAPGSASSDPSAITAPLNTANSPLANSPSPEVPLNFGGSFAGARNNSPLGTGATSGASEAVPASPSQGEAPVGSAPARTEIALSVPTGAIAPAAFMDRTPRTPQQQAAIDQIARDFEAAVSDPPSGITQEETWTAARQLADQRYLTLFGYQAYNQYHLQAAKEAVKEKNAQSTGTPSP